MLLAPNELTISTFRRSRSGLVRSPGPETGQILTLFCTRSYCPGMSNRNLTRYQPPSFTMLPTCPERRDMHFPLRRCPVVASAMVPLLSSHACSIASRFRGGGSGEWNPLPFHRCRVYGCGVRCRAGAEHFSPARHYRPRAVGRLVFLFFGIGVTD